MPKKEKKKVREAFNRQCMARDGFKCRLCGWAPKGSDEWLEVHHITNRKAMPYGGYVKENGITLCPIDHRNVEGSPYVIPPDELYKMIGSSYEQALDASRRLC